MHMFYIITVNEEANRFWSYHLQHARSVEALDYLSNHVDAKGRKVEVIKVPLPPPQHYSEV